MAEETNSAVALGEDQSLSHGSVKLTADDIRLLKVLDAAFFVERSVGDPHPSRRMEAHLCAKAGNVIVRAYLSHIAQHSVPCIVLFVCISLSDLAICRCGAGLPAAYAAEGEW